MCRSLPSKRLAMIASVTAAILLFSIHPSRAQQASPAAPVPPEVAIPRPSAAEIEQVEESLKKYLETMDSATKAILARFPELVAVRPPRENTAIIPSLAQFFRAKHADNVKQAQQGDIDVLFMGD